LRHGEREREHPLDVFHRDFNDLFENLWRDFDLPMFGRHEVPFGAMVPTMDVTEDEERFRVAVELPGMDEKDVEVVLSDNGREEGRDGRDREALCLHGALLRLVPSQHSA
jgi:HSP20 family molecular chaperone IbpA